MKGETNEKTLEDGIFACEVSLVSEINSTQQRTYQREAAVSTMVKRSSTMSTEPLRLRSKPHEMVAAHV